MSTVVQTRYRGRIEKGVNGLVVDESHPSVVSRVCNGADIPYGLAVSQRVGYDKEIILGGDAFLGISVRDVTLDGVSLNPLGNTPVTRDVYEDRRQVAVLTGGRAWVTTDNPVSAGDPLYFDYVTGQLGNSDAGRSAHGFIEFSTLPADDDTLTINGKAVTLGGETPDVAIPQTLAGFVEALAAFLNASVDTDIDDATYEAYPGNDDAWRLTISHDTPGTGGNSFTLAKSCAAATLSGATLSGGFGATAATGDILFSAQPDAGSKLTLNGVEVTFGDGTGGTINRGADLAAAVDNAVTFLNGSGNAEIAKCTYSATGTPTHNNLHIVSDTTGQAMNAWTMEAEAASHGVPSGPTLEGGAPASVAVSTAWWATSALAGDLAQISLGMPR